MVVLRAAMLTLILAAAAVPGGSRLAAQPPPGSDVPPAITRLAWEETGYASGPERWLHLPFLERRDFYTYGWLEAGIGANNWGSPFNGPVTLADRAWQGQLNQLYFVTERVADGGDGWDWGGRVDLLFGTDYLFTTARGLDAYFFKETGLQNVASWDFSKDYGLAMPQLYADFARAGFNLRFGHFYSILGYEQVPAVGNFFYTHCFSMQFSPFTFTGFLGSWQPNEQLTIYAGIHNGWNNFSDPMRTSGPWAVQNMSYPGAGSMAGFLGGMDFSSSDGAQTLSIMTTTGNERTALGLRPEDGSLVGNRSLISTVYTNKLTDRLTYVFQNDNAWQFNAGVTPGNAGQPAGLAQWYSFINYLFWKFDEKWVGGVRLEYFRDNNGYVVSAPIRNESVLGNLGYWAGNFAGNFWELTFGLNYYRSRNLVIRPELRYDWFAPNSPTTNRPYGKPLGQRIGAAGDQLGQFYAGCDMILQW
ncbi:MAG: hypothetical protein RLZZ440_1938 [Planctomycetota bacterium]|jgi:hypothetical protein